MSEIKPPSLEKDVGMEFYLSKTLGIGGVIKETPEDFKVEEITPEGKVLEIDQESVVKPGEKQEYLHFTLQKYNWPTMRAIKEISRRLRVSHKRLGFAGTKDKRALTTQRISLWNTDIEKLLKVRVKDIQIKNPVYEPGRINLGYLQGNRFTICLKKVSLEEEEIKKRIAVIMKELHHQVPGYFGVQRFGIQRPITHLVGKELLKKNFQEAVMIYLSAVFPLEGAEASEARQNLKESGDFKEALLKFPDYLDYEKSMLNHLVNTPTDFIGALRRLPKKLRWLFVHAYQAYLFNKALSYYIKEKKEVDTLPLVGYESDLDESSAQLLQQEGLSLSDFKVAPMPELSSAGEIRKTFFKVKDFKINSFSPNEVVIQFSLPKGTYATVLLREITKNSYW